MATFRFYLRISKIVNINNNNNNGPSDDPWGTPQFIVLISESKPFIDTNCFRSFRYDFINLLTLPHKP